MADDNGGRVTWVLVDGENIDATLGRIDTRQASAAR